MKPDVNCLFSTLFGEPFLSSQQLSPTLQTWTGVGDDAVNANDVQPFHSQQACAHAVAFFNVLDWWRACPTNCRPGVIFAIDVFGKHCVGPPPSCRPVSDCLAVETDSAPPREKSNTAAESGAIVTSTVVAPPFCVLMRQGVGCISEAA